MPARANTISSTQLVGPLQFFFNTFRDRPESRSTEFASFVHQNSAFAQSWIIADPDYLLEPLPYYHSNPVWRVREQRTGPLVVYSRAAQLWLTLDDILAKARKLHASSGKPVRILMATHLDEPQAEVVHQGYNWVLEIKPDAVNRFLRAVIRVARFSPASSDKTFEVYRLS